MAGYQVFQRLLDERGIAVSKDYLTIEDIGEGYYKVSKCDNDNIVYNIINRKGIEFSEEWFSFIGEYHNGKAIVVTLDGKYNLITRYAKKLMTHSRKYTSMEYITGDFYLVQNSEGKYALIGKQNKVLHGSWFHKITNITSQGAIVINKSNSTRKVEDEEKYMYNYLTPDGKLLLIRPCPRLDVYDGYVRAYFVDTTIKHKKEEIPWQRIVRIRDGRVRAEGYFTNISDIENGYKLIQIEGERRQFNLLDPGYNLVFERWFDDISVFFYGCNNRNVFYAAGNFVDGKIFFKVYDEDKRDIFQKFFDTLYPLNTKKGEYVLIKGEEQYKAYMMRKILSKI